MRSLRCFISAPSADLPLAAALQRAIEKAVPDISFVFWEGAQLPDTAYRAQAARFLESAHWFLVLHSEQYALHPNQRWEWQAALIEKQRRPDGFFIAVLQARLAVFDPETARFPILPQRDVALSGPEPDRQMVLAVTQLRDLIYQSVDQSPAAVSQRWIPITIPDLQERLREVADRHNLSDVLRLLNLLVFEEKRARMIRQLEDDIVSVDYIPNLSLDDYIHEKDKLRAQIEEIIQSVSDEAQLNPQWRAVFLEHYRQVELHRNTAFFFPSEDILIPGSHETAAEQSALPLTLDEIGAFRRLLLLCQDALGLEKYAAAWGYAEQARTTIDPQSAQLYEYLLIAFIKKEGAGNIIKRWIEGIPSAFQHVKLYSDRLDQYQFGEAPQCPSATGTFNRAVAVEELASALHAVYTGIRHDAVCDTGARDQNTQEGRQTVLRSMEALAKIYYSLAPVRIFLDTLLIELVGGGKYHWLERIDFANERISFICNSPFDLKGKTDELLSMLEKADPKRSAAKQREMIREDLFWGLLNKCENLAAQIAQEKRRRHQETDLRRSVIRVVQACVTGHYLLTRPGDIIEAEKSLLRLAAELLIPQLMLEGGQYQLPEAILLDWFTLDAQGQLTTVDTGPQYRDFDPLAVMRQIVSDMAGAPNWTIVAENMRRETWLRYLKETDALFETVDKGLQWSDFRKMPDIEARRIAVEGLRRLHTAFLAYPDTSQNLADRALHELSGKGLLLWLALSPDALRNHPDNAVFQFDALSAMRQWLPKAPQWTETSLSAEVVGNLYRRQLAPAYESLSRGREKERAKAAEWIGALLHAFKIHPLPMYLDQAYKEITEEIKFKWIEIDPKGQWINFSTDLDAVGILEQLTQLFDQRFPQWDTRKKLADARWKEQLTRYERDISAIRHENRLPERQIVADIIWRLKGVYQFHPDLKYLELPLAELNDKGRIRWFHREIGIFKTHQNHFENAQIGFDLKAERIELQLLIKKPLI